MISLESLYTSGFVWLCMICLLSACSKEKSTENNTLPVTLSFKPLAYGAPIDTAKTYINNSGESYKITKFMYYVTDIEWRSKTGQVFKDSSYHLIDLYDTASQKFSVQVERGVYDTIFFSIGVDSIHNVSGAQSGALDPMKGMFWTWSTGYIFVKFEGRSPASSAPNQQFLYHIGGFRTGENALRTLALATTFDVDKHYGIEFSADVANWFDGPNPIKIASTPAIMTPGPAALKIADNYAQMFNFVQIINR